MICTYQDEDGWMAWKGFNIEHLWGYGESEEEALRALEERIERWQNS